MKNIETKEVYPNSYKVIFNSLKGNVRQNKEIVAITNESAEIDEIRKVAIDISTPQYSFGFASSLDIVPSFQIHFASPKT